MAKKDHYWVLGVSREETTDGIRSAFRKLAKEYHPDRCGREGTRCFQEISVAYEILSDPEKRRRYDRELREQEARNRNEAYSVPVNVRRRGASSSSTFGKGGPFERREASLFKTLFDSVFDEFAMFRRSSRTSSSRGRELEIALSAEEAARGGRLSLRIPVTRRCPFCRGTGHTPFFVCLQCDGEGTIEAPASFELHIPPNVKDGASVQLPLSREGRWGDFLRIRVRIEERR